MSLSVKEARDFVLGQGAAQVFQPAPKSQGKITSPEMNDRWMCDLMDFKSRTPEKNDGFRLALVCVDVFSRMLYAEPLKTKEPEEVAAAFQRIKRAAGAVPKEVSTDAGAELKGVFSEMLEKEGIGQRTRRSRRTIWR